MRNQDTSKKALVKAANVAADLSLGGFCWFIFHQPKMPEALLAKKLKEN